MTASTVTYVPADPLGVDLVTRLRLWTTADRSGTPVVDVGPAVQQPDLAWQFTVPDGTPDGLYYATTTVRYTDLTTQDDADDTVTLPFLPAAQPGDPISPWVTTNALHIDARLAALDLGLLGRCAQAATDLLWALSGRQFGGLRTADLLVLPPACSCDQSRVGRSDMWSTNSGSFPGVGGWPIGWVFGCACSAEVTLPDTPVDSIVRVSIDGVTVSAAGYRLDDNAILVRTDGSYWPLTGLGIADTATPRMRVVYVWGLTPPTGAVIAAQMYATELALALTGNSDCRLPDRVTSITRQDLIKTFADPTVLLEQGLTGISVVDQWVRSMNPRAQTGARPRVLSPDLPRMRRT